MWNELRYALFGGRLFERNKEAAIKHNMGVLRVSLISSILVFGLLFIGTFTVPSLTYLRPAYLIILCASVIFLLLEKWQAQRVGMALSYAVYAVFIGYSAITSAFVSPDYICVTALAFIFQFQVLYLDKNWRINTATLLSAVVYLGIVCRFKNAGLMTDEIVNVALFSLLSVIIGAFTRRTRLEHYDMKRSLESYAYTDELTELYNRRGFFAKAEELIAEHEPSYYVMACFDVNSFKVVNDQYGTQQGDAVLRHIADTFRKGFEPEGGICCRISADNFAVLYPKSLMDSEKLSKIRKTAAASEGPVMPLTFSIGRYIVDNTSLSASAMYDRASLAEQLAKGRYDENIFICDESMRERLLHEQRIVTEMRPALESGQFEVWLQPQYNHVSGALIGSEALVRWRHPQSGLLIPPGEFIPVFERNGFVYEMDKYVWEQSCILLLRWIDEGRNPLPVSVNVSRHDVFHADFYDTITGLLERYGLPVGLLRLEITESAFAKATEQIVSMVKKLIAYGFTVEIDDFGSGYSSLNTLKDVPAQILKLDMRFLEKTDGSERGGIILESIVRMAKWLGMAVIAEGVETNEQADYLKSVGCNYVQGYLYARPMPVADYEALAKGHGREAEMIKLETVDNLDNSRFWDPQSMDTLIFNSYVGGACVFEFDRGQIELLRVNDRFISEIGISFEEGDPLSVLDLYQYMDEDSRKAMADCVARTIATGAEVTDEFRLPPAKGRIESKQYIRCTLRAIARVGERVLFYCVVGNVTAQRRSEQKEREAMAALAQMVQDMPGGYAKMKITPTGIVPMFLNDEFCRLCGMTHEQAISFYSGNAYTGVHPDDIEPTNALISEAIENRTTVSLRVRLTNGRGDYVPLQAFYRVTEDADGLYLNGYYSDATEQVREEERQRELLDNLPYGAALYQYDGNNLSAIHLNKRYWELVERSPIKYEKISFVTAVHPDDRQNIFKTLSEAIRLGQDVVCDLRVLYGKNGGYRPFHIVGNIVRSENGVYSIYAVYTPIEQEAMAYREMLPIALSTIMESTGDLSFIKDKSLRYICASRAFADMVGIGDVDAIVGKTDYDLFDAELADKYRRDDEALLKSQSSIVNIVEDIPSAEGARRYSRTSKYLLYDAAGNVIGLYGFGRDITSHMNLEQAQHDAAEQLGFLNDTAHSLLSHPDIEAGINGTLQKLREYFDGNRAYVFEYDHARSVAANTYESYAEGISAQRDNLQAVPLALMGFWQTAFQHQKWLAIRDVSELDDSRAEEREILLSQGIRSLYAVPLCRDGEIIGMLGVDDPRRQMTHLDRLLALGDYIAVMLTRRDYERRLSEEARANEQMMQDMPGGYAKMRIEGRHVVPVFLNDVFCRMSGMTHEQAMSLYANNAYAGVHPEDMEYVQSVISEAIANRTTLSLRLRLADGRGGYKPMQVFYRVTEDASGLYLNGYYTDVTEISRLEEQRQELLENLPCGAGIYEIDSDGIRATYLNKQYRAYFRREIDERSETPAFDVVHPDDIDSLKAELQKAMTETGEGSCDIRIMDGIGGYITFHVTGRVMEHNLDKTVLYVIYVPVTERELLIRRRAETDGMTGVYNKATTEMLIRERLAGGGCVSCAMMIADIDNLKTINDAMGHPQGDRAICLIADALKAQFRKTDIIGRIGGDEFLIYLEGVQSEEKLRDMVSGLMQSIAAVRIGEGDDYPIHASIGVAKAVTGETSFKTLYLQADKALYEAKRRGKNRFAFFVTGE